MSELTLVIFRIGFLIALWVFVLFVVYAIRTDLFGARVKKLPAQKKPAENKSVFVTSTVTPAAKAKKDDAGRPRSLVITSGANAGTTLVLAGEALSIGRSSDSTIVIQDDYTSTHHARLENRAGTWFVNDLGSTNGTYVNGKKISAPVELQIGTTIAIGETNFEIRG